MLEPGAVIHRYVVEALIGRGGMGAVYRARDTHLDRAVALKVLSDSLPALSDTEARERLVREARAAAALSHPNAVAIHDAGDSEHGPFIVMELVEGDTLRSLASTASASQIIDWMKAAALALAAAHERGIVHRDVKPDNLMVRSDGILKVLDFGVARLGIMAADPTAPTQSALPTLTSTGVHIGTPQYMSPEQIKGRKVDGRTDQFAWAVSAHEALAGRSPWHATIGSVGLIGAILDEEPEDLRALRPEVPEHVARAIARAMAKRPDDRFASMHDLLRALDGLEGTAEDPPRRRAALDGASAPAPRAAPTRYGEATLQAVIGKALELERTGGYSKGELQQAARELGIPDDAVEEAAAAIRAEKRRGEAEEARQALRAQILLRRRRAFYNHLIAYVGVNLIILTPIFIKQDMGSKIFALFIPAIAWGIGLAIHLLRAFSREVDSSEMREAIAREDAEIAADAAHRAEVAAKLERQARRGRMKDDAAAVGRAVEEGVASILSAAANRVRNGDPRMRIAPERVPTPATDMRAEAEADAEAAAAEIEERRRRRS